MKQRWIAKLLVFVMLITSAGVKSMNNSSVMASAGTGNVLVMTYNILTTGKQAIGDTGPDGKTRGQMLIELLENYHPDSIGFNEVTEEWKTYLESNVVTHAYSGGVTYAIAGTKSENNSELKSGSSEYSLILYRSDKYELVKDGGYWLSDTPDVPSKYTDIKDNSGNVLYAGMTFNRVMSYAVLREKATGNISYVHVNTHFDHQSSDYINVLCSRQVANKANELSVLYQCPVIISGDFNSNEGSDAYNYLALGEHGYVNAKYRTDIRSNLPTAPGYGTGYNPSSTSFIDHIFVPKNVGVYMHNVIVNPYLSDHSCVYARLSLNTMPILYDVSVDGSTITGFSPYAYSLNSTTENDFITLSASAVSGSSIYVEISGTYASSVSGSAITVNVSLQNGDNRGRIIVDNNMGLRTVYYLNIYKSYGEPIPIISEIYPNAEADYRYFEVTNVGTKAFNTADYYFLWGNISSEKTSWDAVFIPKDVSQHKTVNPGETVVFWVTKGGTFAGGEPKVADFNAKYNTYLTEDQIIISDMSTAFIRYKDNGSVDSANFDMGSNVSRGMRIARARDESGNPYSWQKNPNDFAYMGPSVSVSTYYGLASGSITNNQLFKFRYNGQVLTAASDVLEASDASPGVYDERLGNEIKDAYSRIEAEWVYKYSVIKVENTVIGNTRSGGWAFYANVDFGTTGSTSAVFYGSVRGSNASGKIEIYIDGTRDGDLSNAVKIGECKTTGTSPDDWTVFREFTCELDQLVTGVHNVTLRFVPDSGKTYVINLDYFYFNPLAIGPDLTGVDAFKFMLDGEELTADTVVKTSFKKYVFILSNYISYTPADAVVRVTYTSDNPAVAEIENSTGNVTVLSSGEVTFTANIICNGQVFTTYTSPKINFVLANDAYQIIEAEWADNFTDGVNKDGQVDRAGLKYAGSATGMSPNLTNGYNYLGNTVNQSTARIRGVDFGDGIITGLVFNMALRTDRCSGTAKLYKANPDGSPGSLIGYVTVTDNDATDGGAGNYNTYKLFNGVVVDKDIKGIHDIIIEFNVDPGFNYVGNIDYFYFVKSSLDEIKNAACAELDNYKDPSLYRPAQQAELAQEIAKGKERINAATTYADVANALAEAKAKLDAIKTDQELTDEEQQNPTPSPTPTPTPSPTPTPTPSPEPTPTPGPVPGTSPTPVPGSGDNSAKPAEPAQDIPPVPTVTPAPEVTERETTDPATGIKTSVRTVTYKDNEGNPVTTVFMNMQDGDGNNTVAAVTMLHDGTVVETSIIKDAEGSVTSAVSTAGAKTKTEGGTLKVDVEIPYTTILDQVKDLLSQDIEVQVVIPGTVLREMKKDTDTVAFNIQMPAQDESRNAVKIGGIILPENIIKTAKQNGTGIVAEVTDDEGKPLYSWNIDGKLLAESDRKAGDINLGLKIERGISSVSDVIKANLQK